MTTHRASAGARVTPGTAGTDGEPSTFTAERLLYLRERLAEGIRRGFYALPSRLSQVTLRIAL